MIAELLSSAVAGLVASLLTTALRAVQAWRDARRKLREAEISEFQDALNSDSLSSLGGYLDGPIGSFLVTEYADNAAVKARVNTFLARLEQFVGKRPADPSGRRRARIARLAG
jgi:hypothetical protein